jgi:hypothetical protein
VDTSSGGKPEVTKDPRVTTRCPLAHTQVHYQRTTYVKAFSFEVIEVIDFILNFSIPPHQIRRLWRHPRPTYQSTIG